MTRLRAWQNRPREPSLPRPGSRGAGRLPPWPSGTATFPEGTRDPDTRRAEPDTCSAKGCQAPAIWELLWNNPKLHTPERRKVWLACDEHRPSLSDFLAARQFLKDVVPH